MTTKTLSPELLEKMDAYWRAVNYLSVGQIYLYGNPLLKLKRPLTLADVKHMLLLGHDPRPELHLRATEQGHQEIRPKYDLRLGPRNRQCSPASPVKNWNNCSEATGGRPTSSMVTNRS